MAYSSLNATYHFQMIFRSSGVGPRLSPSQEGLHGQHGGEGEAVHGGEGGASAENRSARITE